MKKKFVLTLALVLLVAVSLTAAPLEVSGEFSAGYDFGFTSGAKTFDGTGAEAAIDAQLAFTGDFWKVTLASGSVNFDGDMGATAEIYLDKALAAQGTDMGDLTLTMKIGNMKDIGGLSVYSNTRDKLKGLKMKAAAPESAASLTIGYGSLVSVMVGADVATFDADKAFIVSAKTTPVDGVSAAVAYTNVSKVYDGVPQDLNYSADGAVAGSVKVDVAALAGLDFGLTASAYDLYLLESKENNLYVELNGSVEDFSLWTEYRIRNAKQNDMKLGVSYAGIENVGLSASVTLDDITKVNNAKMETTIGAGANYSMGGVKYALDTSYEVVAKTFTLSPSVTIAF